MLQYFNHLQEFFQIIFPINFYYIILTLYMPIYLYICTLEEGSDKFEIKIKF